MKFIILFTLVAAAMAQPEVGPAAGGSCGSSTCAADTCCQAGGICSTQTLCSGGTSKCSQTVPGGCSAAACKEGYSPVAVGTAYKCQLSGTFSCYLGSPCIHGQNGNFWWYDTTCCGQTNQISIIICTILVVPFLLWMCVGMCNTKLRRERQRRGVVSGEDIQTRYFQSRWRQDE